MSLGEWRDDEAPMGVKAGTPGGWKPHALDRPGRTNDNRLCPSQQELEAFLLHGRLKPTDDRNPSFSQHSGQVVCTQDDLTGTTRGAEKPEKRLAK
jgi:hypothetical protein